MQRALVKKKIPGLLTWGKVTKFYMHRSLKLLFIYQRDHFDFVIGAYIISFPFELCLYVLLLLSKWWLKKTMRGWGMWEWVFCKLSKYYHLWPFLYWSYLPFFKRFFLFSFCFFINLSKFKSPRNLKQWPIGK